MKFEIKSRFSGAIIFSIETDNFKLAVEAAIKSGADLYGADLSGANLSGADLSRANLSDAKNADLVVAQTYICPESGAFEGWKKCRGGVLVRLRIPAEAERSNSTGRKCRADFVDVLEVIGAEKGISIYDQSVTYVTGQRVTCDNWNKNRWEECGGGIHFFITRKEAEAYE